MSTTRVWRMHVICFMHIVTSMRGCWLWEQGHRKTDVCWVKVEIDGPISDGSISWESRRFVPTCFPVWGKFGGTRLQSTLVPHKCSCIWEGWFVWWKLSINCSFLFACGFVVAYRVGKDGCGAGGAGGGRGGWGWRGNTRLFANSLDDGVGKKKLSSAVICFHEHLKIKFKIRSFASV